MSKLIKEAITEYFGPQCPDYDEDCVCCNVWKEYEALTAAAPHMSGVKVEQLEWEGLTAHTEFGTYTIEEDECDCYSFRFSGIQEPSESWRAFEDDAKTAAQADYEKRVLSALESSSQSRNPLPSELIREYVEDYEWRTDSGDYTPNNTERAMIEGAIAGYEGYVDEVLTSSERDQALEEGYRLGVKDAAKKAAELLVFTDTTSKAIKEIIAAIRALKSQPAPRHPDDIAVDNFAAQMKAKLAKKRAEGRSGWQNMSAHDLSVLLHEHVAKGDPIDVANLCMMLAMNRQHITPAPQTGGGDE